MLRTKRRMSDLEIASRLRAKRNFSVPGNLERKAVLQAAKWLGLQVSTRANDDGGYTIRFIAN